MKTDTHSTLSILFVFLNGFCDYIIQCLDDCLRIYYLSSPTTRRVVQRYQRLGTSTLLHSTHSCLAL